MVIKNSADLKAAILELELRKIREKQLLADDFHGLTKSLMPMNLLKSTISKVKHSPGMTSTLLKAGVGLGVGFISKKFIIGKSTGIFKRLLGSAIEMGIAGLVAKKSDNIKSSGIHLFKNLFRSKN